MPCTRAQTVLLDGWTRVLAAGRVGSLLFYRVGFGSVRFGTHGRTAGTSTSHSGAWVQGCFRTLQTAVKSHHTPGIFFNSLSATVGTKIFPSVLLKLVTQIIQAEKKAQRRHCRVGGGGA